MRRLLASLAVFFALCGGSALAADGSVPSYTAATSVADTDILYCAQSAGTLDRKCTPLQLANYLFGKVSGDLTCTSTGGCTVTKTNGTAFGALATVTPGTGVATATGVNVGTAGSVVVNGGALGTPSSGVGTNLTGTAAGLTAGTVTTNANLTGDVTSSGNATTLTNAPVIAKVLTGFTSGAGTVTAADSILTAIQKVYGNDALKLPLAGGTMSGNIAMGGNAITGGGAITGTTLTASTSLTLSAISGSTQCLNVNTSGVVSGTGSACGSGGGTGANPTATAGPAAVNGSATTFMRSDGAPAVQVGSASQKGILQVDGTTITASSGVISATTTVTSRTVTGASDTILSTDKGNIVYYNSASAVAVTQPAPSGSFAAGFYVTLCNINVGLPTVTPGSGTIGGAGTFALPIVGTASNPACAAYQSDGTNFNLAPNYILSAALLTTGTLADARLSSNVPLKNAAATITGAYTFGEVVGGGRTVSGTTDTLAATDCGTTVTYSNASAVTVTIPQGLPTICVISVMQIGAGKVSVNGSAVTPATLHTHVASGAATGTAGQYATINLTNYTTNTVNLTGDGS